jgi:hypothetical protein
MVLATASKGTSSIADFFSKVKGLADDMAAAGKKLEDEVVASYILTSLDEDFNPIVSTISARTTPITLGELYTQLTGWEQRINLLNPREWWFQLFLDKLNHPWWSAWRRRPQTREQWRQWRPHSQLRSGMLTLWQGGTHRCVLPQEL